MEQRPIELLADTLRSPRFLYHVLTANPGVTDHVTAPELAARVALVLAGSAVVESVAEKTAESADTLDEEELRERCSPPRARDARAARGMN